MNVLWCEIVLSVMETETKRRKDSDHSKERDLHQFTVEKTERERLYVERDCRRNAKETESVCNKQRLPQAL